MGTSEDVPCEKKWGTVLPVGSLKGKCSMEVSRVSVIPDLSTNVVDGGRSLDFIALLFGLSWQAGPRQLIVHQVNKLLMVLDTSSADDDSVGGEVLILEFLEDVSSEVGHVVLVSVERHTKATGAIGQVEYTVVKGLVATVLGIQLVSVVVFVDADVGSHH